LPDKVYEIEGKIYSWYREGIAFKDEDGFYEDYLNRKLEKYDGEYIKLTIEKYTCEDCEFSITAENGNYVACGANFEDERPPYCKYKD
jgi:hypothetical protein